MRGYVGTLTHIEANNAKVPLLVTSKFSEVIGLDTAVDSLLGVVRRTAAQFETLNPTLAAGQRGYENNTGRLKIGDGVTPWNRLQYVRPKVT